jgi:U3 small nucleolar RNA-associated protein 12
VAIGTLIRSVKQCTIGVQAKALWTWQHSHAHCLAIDDLAVYDRSAVTALRFNASGVQLASGAQDTDIVVWDVVSQAGLFRLRGHHGQVCQSTTSAIFAPTCEHKHVSTQAVLCAACGATPATAQGCAALQSTVGQSGCLACRQVTGLAWLEGGGQLASCGKDGYVKVWDLATQHCSQTVVGHRCAKLWQEGFSVIEVRAGNL